MSHRSVEKIIKTMNETGVKSVSIETYALWGLIKKIIYITAQSGGNSSEETAATGASTTAVAAEVPAAKPVISGNVVTSPMVGVIYLAPEPNSKPFITVGQKVSKGDTLCLVEAMKTFNPIKATADGTIVEILVKDGDTVEFGAQLLVIK